MISNGALIATGASVGALGGFLIHKSFYGFSRGVATTTAALIAREIFGSTGFYGTLVAGGVSFLGDMMVKQLDEPRFHSPGMIHPRG